MTQLQASSPPATLETPSGKNKNTENFPVGSFLIRAELRPHIHAFYNFARAADDIADNPLLFPSDKIGRLTHFEKVLMGEASDNDIAVAMRDSLRQTRITPQHCLDLLRAFKQDAVKFRYRNWDELLEYCRYSASPVGRYVLALHGIGENAWPTNDALCTALQIINHLQDCGDDYRELDRVYIPQDDMEASEATINMLSMARLPVNMRRVIDHMLDRMGPMMESARQLPNHVPDFRLKMETAIIGSLADDLIALLKRRDPLAETTKLSKPALIMAVLKGVRRTFA